MSSIKSIYRVGQISVRHFANAPKKNEIHPGYFKLKEIQKLYQKDDGLPVHLKRGTPDKIIYYLSFGLCGVGVVLCADYFYHMP